MNINTTIWSPDKPRLIFTESQGKAYAHIFFEANDNTLQIILPAPIEGREALEALAQHIVNAFDRYVEFRDG